MWHHSSHEEAICTGSRFVRHGRVHLFGLSIDGIPELSSRNHVCWSTSEPAFDTARPVRFEPSNGPIRLGAAVLQRNYVLDLRVVRRQCKCILQYPSRYAVAQKRYSLDSMLARCHFLDTTRKIVKCPPNDFPFSGERIAPCRRPIVFLVG